MPDPDENARPSEDAPGEAAKSSVVCTNGHRMRSSKAFCTECGAMLRVIPPTVPEKPPPALSGHAQRSRRVVRWSLVGAAALVVLCLALAAGFAMARGTDSSSHADADTGPTTPTTSAPPTGLTTASATGSATPPEVSASPRRPTSGPDCSTLAEVPCQEVNAVSDICAGGSDGPLNTDPPQQSLGLDRIQYGQDAATALTSGDIRGVFVESCGSATNGIDVLEMHQDIIRQATSRTTGTGQLESVDAVICHAMAPIDQAPGGTKTACDVYSDGFANPAYVTVTSESPYYSVEIPFGD